MAVYLSPGVFPREIDLSALPAVAGPLRPAFIGTAKKGPVGVPVFLSSAQQAIDVYGEPFPESSFMYAILASMEENNQCYGMRVAVECEDGQPDALADICIDTSGGRGKGWGRIPLFTGIDYGRIDLREISADNPLVFHAASVDGETYNDASLSTTDGATDADITVTGTYTGSIDDSYLIVITSAPDLSASASIEGAEYEVIRNSDGEVVATGTLDEIGTTGVSTSFTIDQGLSASITVNSGDLDINDTFGFNVHPNNKAFSVAVEGDSSPTAYTMPNATYTTVSAFVTAFNALLSGEDYQMVAYETADGTTIPQLRTTTAGEWIQVTSSDGWAKEVGTSLYAWDIPRSYLLGTDSGPYNITSQNNRVVLNVIGSAETKQVEFNIAAGLGQSASAIAASVDLAGVVTGDTLFDSFVLTVPGDTDHVVIITSTGHKYDTLQLRADFTYIRTLRFAEELGIDYPYKRAYRGFSDNRLLLPDSGESDAATPLSCETNPLSADCASDSAYFENIVGWLVAPSPGTWLAGYTATLDIFTDGIGDAAGRYKLTIKDAAGAVVDISSDLSFDKRDARYIGNVLNPGTSIGGSAGNSFVNWEERPAFLDNDVNSVSYTVRLPSQFSNKEFDGMANGIPLDPAYSSELDAAVIGNPNLGTGLYAFQNPEAIDINVIAVPGFSSGSVIGTTLQLCESRGDVIYLVDPPFGLRPQQVVDWHNGMLLSDLSSAINSSYGALYWGWIKIYDQFSKQEIWVPPSGHVSAVFARTSRDAEQWFAPAGLRRGRLLTALDVEYSPGQGERDLLYGSGNAVNPLPKFPQSGIVVWGQRTLQRSSTALDRVNVRMLLIYLKKNLISLLRNFIFEPNDKTLWSQVTATINPFLADVAARRGMTGFKVVCDESNNTPDRIDRHELWVSIFIQPTESTEFVVLNMITLRTGASFSSQEALAAAGIATSSSF